MINYMVSNIQTFGKRRGGKYSRKKIYHKNKRIRIQTTHNKLNKKHIMLQVVKNGYPMT